MKGKKAQVTLFIILGIVVLAGTATLIYMRQTTEKAELSPQVAETEEARYEGEMEIRNFVDSCLKSVTYHGLEIQRLQGGYIEIPSNKDTLTIKEKIENQQVKEVNRRKSVEIDPSGPGNKAPFWVTRYNLDIPSKEFMERELENYVSKELDECVGDFDQFTNKGFQIEKGRVKTEASFAQSTWVMTNFPLTVSINDITYQINDFNLETPINMGLIYEIASSLSYNENEHAYLEHFTLDLVDKYQWVPGSQKTGSTTLPPKRKTDTSFDCSQTTWNIDEVRTDLMENYHINFKYLKIGNTNFEREIRTEPMQQGVFDSYIYNLLPQAQPSIKTEFIYDLDWFFNLDMLPKSGSQLRPERTTLVGVPMLPRLCTFKYRFNYFYDFPVLLKITDDKSAKINIISNTIDKEGGYEFHIPLWINVCGNQKRECTGRADSFAVSDDMQETDFCEDTQRLSGNIKINVKDETLPLGEVDIHYIGASTMQNCFIGRTLEDGLFTTKLPFCEGCQIELHKQGYPSKRLRFDVLDYRNKEVTFQMDPFVNLTVNVKLIHMPTFIKNWYETDHFGNADKMIKLAGEYGFDTSILVPSVSELKSNKPLMAALRGEIDTNPTYNDKVIIKGEGINEFLYIYPDPDDAKLSLAQGTYEVGLSATGNVDIEETDYGYGGVVDAHKGPFALSPETEYTWDTGNLRGKYSVTFFVPVQHTSIEMNPTNWKIIDDGIMQDGVMKAELLYESNSMHGAYGAVVGCGNYTFSKIDGRNNIDLSDGICRKRFEVDIAKPEYLKYMRPELN